MTNGIKKYDRIMPIAINEYRKIYIFMNFDKINNGFYPHFDVLYDDSIAKFAIDLSIIELSNLPIDIANEVIDWAKKNHDELLKFWLRMLIGKKHL